MAYDAVKMPDWQISEEAEKNMPTPEEWQEKLGLEKDEMLPMGRLAKPDEIASAVAFLACRDSAYITGTELAVNGGLWLG